MPIFDALEHVLDKLAELAGGSSPDDLADLGAEPGGMGPADLGAAPPPAAPLIAAETTVVGEVDVGSDVNVNIEEALPVTVGAAQVAGAVVATRGSRRGSGDKQDSTALPPRGSPSGP